MTRGINNERPFGGRRGHNSNSQKGVLVAKSASCVAENDKAILCFINEGPELQATLPGMKARDPRPHAADEIWVPKSQVHDDSEVYGRGHEGKLIVTPGLASKEGWG